MACELKLSWFLDFWQRGNFIDMVKNYYPIRCADIGYEIAGMSESCREVDMEQLAREVPTSASHVSHSISRFLILCSLQTPVSVDTSVTRPVPDPSILYNNNSFKAICLYNFITLFIRIQILKASRRVGGCIKSHQMHVLHTPLRLLPRLQH